MTALGMISTPAASYRTEVDAIALFIQKAYVSIQVDDADSVWHGGVRICAAAASSFGVTEAKSVHSQNFR